MSDPLYPQFRRNTKTGELLLTDTLEAIRVKKPEWSPALSPELVDKQAKQKVKARGGSELNEKDVLGEYQYQLGRFRGKSFRWLLENAPGYVGWLIGDIAKEKPDQKKSSPHQIQNQEALKKYTLMFEEGRKIILMKSRPQLAVNRLIESKLPLATIQRRLSKLKSPSKFTPNMPEKDDEDLVACLEACETTTFVQDTRATLAPPPKTITTSQIPKATDSNETETLDVPVIPTAEVTLPSEQDNQLLPTTEGPLLYEGWKSTLPKVDHQWISKTFFTLSNNRVEFQLSRVSQLWYYPPQPTVSVNNRNRVDRYFSHKLFLWMPINFWSVILRCPQTDGDSQDVCNGVLTRSGTHQKTRLVLDIDDYYIIAAEYLRCSKCKKKMIAWAHNIVSQLDRDRQLLFPCILTAKYACDKKVVQLLRQRGLGNSSSMVQKQLEEQHGDRYLRCVHHYLSSCKSFLNATRSGLLTTLDIENPPSMIPVPLHRWLMKIYQLDVLQRIDIIKAGITSVFGRILKLDSTKKITKKLAGRSAKTAMWATNVGNEYGQVIMTVLTANEGQGLRKMIEGLCCRYDNACVPAPVLLYVDRDCCGNACVSKYFTWPYLCIRLDIWHFMRRLSVGCTTDAHPLYGTFMKKLSHCIFKWEEEDVKKLKAAKRAELLHRHVPDPSDADVVRHISSDELALHCRRMTRGTDETITLISQLIASLEGDKSLDILGVPLFNDLKMRDIWVKQSQHVACLQDPENVQLYTKIGTLKKGGVELPKYRCARGSTSLESFHLHMNRFIPGTLANDVNFQVFLLDGVHRWNQDRERDMTDPKDRPKTVSYDGILRHSANLLSREVLNQDICPEFVTPSKYTGELIGLEYLYSQSSGCSSPVPYEQSAQAIEEEEDTTLGEEGDADINEDEGFEEMPSVEDFTIPSLTQQEKLLPAKPILHIPSDEEYRSLLAYELTEPSSNSSLIPQFEPQVEKSPASLKQSESRKELSPDQLKQSEPQVEPPPAVFKHPLQFEPQAEKSPANCEQSEPRKELSPAVIKRQLQFEPQEKKSPASLKQSEPQRELSPAQPKQSEPCIEPSPASLILNRDEVDFGPDNIPGYRSIINLSMYFVSLCEQELPLNSQQVNKIIELWNKLSDYDKLRTKFPQRYAGPGSGRFKSPKKQVALGVTSIERAILGPNSTRANWPDCNRYVEATVERLMTKYPSDRRSPRKSINITRWTLVKEAYSKIQNLVLNNNTVMTSTELQLPSLNTKTIQQWYNKKGKAKDLKILLQGIEVPQAAFCGSGAPVPVPKPNLPKPTISEAFPFTYPPDTAGMAKLKVRKPVRPASSTVHSSALTQILPTIAPRAPCPVVVFPRQAIPHNNKRAATTEQEDVPRKKYVKKSTVVKCGSCGKDRLSTGHKQYMGYRYCSEVESLTFEQWRQHKQSIGAARKAYRHKP